jgi:hypothetical protein
MLAAQYRPRFDSVTDGELMPFGAGGNLRFVWLGSAGTQRGVRNAPDCNGQRILSEYASVPRHEYERLAGYIEQARLKSEQAGADLERQATEHGCYPRLSASAAHFSGAHY